MRGTLLTDRVFKKWPVPFSKLPWHHAKYKNALIFKIILEFIEFRTKGCRIKGNDINTIKCFDKFVFYDCKCALANIQTFIYIYEDYARDLTLISGVYLAVALTDLQWSGDQHFIHFVLIVIYTEIKRNLAYHTVYHLSSSDLKL